MHDDQDFENRDPGQGCLTALGISVICWLLIAAVLWGVNAWLKTLPTLF